MMAPSRWGSLPLPEDTSKLAEKSLHGEELVSAGGFLWPLGFSQTPAHIVARICRAQIICLLSVVQSAGALEEMPRLSDAQVVNLARWELNLHAEMPIWGSTC